MGIPMFYTKPISLNAQCQSAGQRESPGGKADSLAIFYPFSQFRQINVFPLSPHKQLHSPKSISERGIIWQERQTGKPRQPVG